MLINTWLSELDKGKKVGVFLSDIAGAFDRVDTRALLAKMERAGVSAKLRLFFSNYLSGRTAVVIVNGVQSETFSIQDMVFQRTVLGPMLWNIFFADVSDSIPHPSVDSKFADDLNVSL